MADQKPLPPALPQPGKDTSAWELLTAKQEQEQKEESDEPDDDGDADD
jgi:hypothetical protein